jgi:HEAT repeat protein
MYTRLVKRLPKMKPYVKTDILNWLGYEALNSPAKNNLIKNLQVSLDVPGKQVLLDQLKSTDPEVKTAAAWALQRIGDTSVISSLAGLLRSENAEEVALGQQTLAAFSGNITDAVTRAIAQGSDAGKIAGLQLLAGRKANLGLGTVIQQTKSDNADVRKAAYVALRDVVEAQNFTNMCGMLEEADAVYVPDMQQAVIATIASLPASEQVQTVTQRMNQSAGKSYLYYTVLATTGDAKALETIKNNLNASNTAVREAAFNALLQWKDQRACEELLNICRNTTSNDQFEKALARYVTLASDATMTGENRLIFLREAMAVAKTDAQRNSILAQIEKTNTFQALMFAGQYLDNTALQQTAASVVMNIAIGHPEFNGTNVRSLLEKTALVLNNSDADYQRQNIRKFLEDNPAEEGFVSIFNGKDLTGWKGLVQDPIKRSKMTAAQLQREQVKADEVMRQNWTVEDGSITYVGHGYDNLCTVKQYGDFEMYVDWMLDPAGPEADAGIYLRGAPQVQIWDTARVNVGAEVGSGGLYNNKIHQDKPLKVADNKLGEWNSFYIKMVGDRVTVRLNGELVVDNVIMENYWDRSQPIFPIEQLELQAHGSKCYFRNIYVKELKRQEPFKLSAQEQKEGFKILFDGTNMYEWTGNLVDYKLNDGCIEVSADTRFGGNLYTVNEYANFIYRFDFQLTPGANNGVGIRTPMEGDAAYVGMEIQILDCEHEIYKNITPLQHHGSVYGIIPARADHHSAFRPAGEWNSEEILADGDHIRVTVNGQVILDGNIREATVNGTADGHEHPGLFNKKGHIGFLGHGSPLKFRNIRIKELK